MNHRYHNLLSQLLPVALGLFCLTPIAARAQALPELPASDPAESQGSPPLPATPLPPGQPLPVRSPEFSTVSPDLAASSYLLGPGDQVFIDVYGYEEYTGPTAILPDGTISLPLVGKVTASGRTTGQLTQELTTVLDTILVDPYVSVRLDSLRPVVVNVSGEVYRPGPVQLQGATNAATGEGRSDTPASVSRALAEAGGITRTADLREIVVMRALPNGETVRTQINLWDALWSETLPEDMLLRDGDLVFVPESAEGDAIDRRLLTSSSLSPETVKVRVVGEVVRPGEVQVPPNSSLSSAVAIAGGPTEDSKLSEVAYVRLNDAGEVQQEVVDLRNLMDNYQVQDGDVIVVPRTATDAVLDVVSRLLGPLNFLFRIFN
ncbi:MAG: polysaccharide biosynthesis/export family protein [Cyanobacteria bacterium P01_F01_bin.4]